MCFPVLFSVIEPYNCLPKGHTELTEPNRHWSYDDGVNLSCDRDVIVSDNWYRFKGAAGVMMATHCIPKESCNTEMAGWVNHPHPTKLYDTVTTTACFHWNSDCCSSSQTIKIKKCNGFFVYRLTAPAGCHTRYCGVNGETYG